MILFLVCPTYLILHLIAPQEINKIVALAGAIPDGIEGFLI